MKRLALTLLLTLAPAQALKLTVWDRDLSSKVGAGESAGNRFNVQLVKDYSGPVIVIFSQSDDEKKSGQYAGLLARYDGLLRAGQLTLLPPSEEKDRTDKTDKTERSAPTAAPQTAPLAAPASGLSLGKLLQPYKLSVTLQTTGLAPGEGGQPLPGVNMPGLNIPGTGLPAGSARLLETRVRAESGKK